MLELRTEVLAKLVCLVVPNLKVGFLVLPHEIAEGIGVLASLASKVLNTQAANRYFVSSHQVPWQSVGTQ